MNLPRLSFPTKLAGICLVTLFTSQSAHAFNLDLNSNSTKQLFSTFENTSFTLSPLLVFEEKTMIDFLKEMKENYLTFYSNKNERIKASYSSGTYFINYTNSW